MKGAAPFATIPGEPNPPSTDPIALLNYALQRHPGSVSLVNFARTVLWTSRGEDGPSGHGGSQGPAPGAYAAVSVPPDLRANLEGPPEEQDAFVLIHIPRAVVDAMDEEVRKPSLILVPPGIVRPS